MNIEIRPIVSDEFVELSRVDGAAFGYVPSDEDIEHSRTTFEFDRSLAAFDNGHIVAAAGAFSFDLTLPGLTTTPAAGVSYVGVLPTHRRRGLLRALMRRQLDDVRARGEALAILTASESVIYGRFGYGLATQSATLEIDPRYGAFRRPLDDAGTMALVDKEAAGNVLPGVYDRVRRGQPGMLTRSDTWWTDWLRDPENWRDGMSARFYVTHTSASGQADGYTTYRIKEEWTNGLPSSPLVVGEVIAATPETYAALWRYLLDVDLIGTVRTRDSSPDEPLRWLLADPRRLRTTRLSDFLWLRVLDVPAALSARRYSLEGVLTFELIDSFCPDNAGRYRLEGGPDGATCRRSDAEPDLTLDVADLGAIYLGGVRPTTLAHAGRIEERVPGALTRADALFAAETIPWCGTGF